MHQMTSANDIYALQRKHLEIVNRVKAWEAARWHFLNNHTLSEIPHITKKMHELVSEGYLKIKEISDFEHNYVKVTKSEKAKEIEREFEILLNLISDQLNKLEKTKRMNPDEIRQILDGEKGNKNESQISQTISNLLLKLEKDAKEIIASETSGNYDKATGIDLLPADYDRNRRKTQKGWIEYFNSQGRKMISMPDLYRAGKAGSNELLQSLKAEFNSRWVCTSTQIKYGDGMKAEITHLFYGKNYSSDIPYYPNGEYIKDIVRTQQGLKFLHALFDTDDSGDSILKALSRLSGGKTSELKIWTLGEESRKKYPVRAVLCDCNGGNFHVSCGSSSGIDDGLSFGVR